MDYLQKKVKAAGADDSNAGDRQPLLQAKGHEQTRRAHLSEVAEDYVELIAALIEEDGEARVVSIAKRLGVTQVTVTKTISRLKRDGLVESEPYRSIFLTDAGWKMARFCKQRHETVLEFLKALGVERAVALADAEGIEHHVSQETLDAFRRYLETNRAD